MLQWKICPPALWGCAGVIRVNYCHKFLFYFLKKPQEQVTKIKLQQEILSASFNPNAKGSRHRLVKKKEKIQLITPREPGAWLLLLDLMHKFCST